MRRHLLLISAVSFLLLAPAVQHQIYGVDKTSTVVQSKIASDEKINQAIKDSITSDLELSKFVNAIKIKVDKGVVTLSGTVDSAQAKSNIESKAKAVMGVDKVVNNIEVQSK